MLECEQPGALTRSQLGEGGVVSGKDSFGCGDVRGKALHDSVGRTESEMV